MTAGQEWLEGTLAEPVIADMVRDTLTEIGLQPMPHAVHDLAFAPESAWQVVDRDDIGPFLLVWHNPKALFGGVLFVADRTWRTWFPVERAWLEQYVSEAIEMDAAAWTADAVNWERTEGNA